MSRNDLVAIRERADRLARVAEDACRAVGSHHGDVPAGALATAVGDAVSLLAEVESLRAALRRCATGDAEV